MFYSWQIKNVSLNVIWYEVGYTVCLLADNDGSFYAGIAEVIGVGTNELTLFGYCDYKNAKYVCVCL